MKIVLLITLGILLYTYLGYPLLLWILSKLFRRPWLRDDRYKPMVSVILAVYNEEIALRDCIRSLFAQDYPKEKIEILIGSDASTDRTDEILDELEREFPQIVVRKFAENRGKVSVVADLAKMASGEILFFFDADVMLHRNCISAHMANYVDREVAAVAGRLAFSVADHTESYAAEAKYWTLESLVRRLESEIKSTACVYGGNYSMRRTIFRMPVNEAVADDYFSSLLIHHLGQRLVYDADALCTELYMRSVRDEFKRKSRNASMGFTTSKMFWQLFMPWSGWSAFTLWPHKVLRWLTPFFLAIAFVSSLVLMIEQQVLGYLLSGLFLSGILFGVIGWFLASRSKPRNWPVFSQAYWVLMMNAAFLNGIRIFALNSDSASWSPIRHVQSMEGTSDS